MRILLTNDDGVEARGLKILETIARSISDDVTIVAPMRDKSGQSRAVTLSEPLRAKQVRENVFAVSGTPADCVVLGVLELMPEKPDLIISGINRGQNLAEDVHYSGTIGAAIMGLHLGVPSIAISQSTGFRGKTADMWSNTAALGTAIIRPLAQNASTGFLLNVNLPDCKACDVKGVKLTQTGARDKQMLSITKRTDPRNNDYYWIGYGGGKSSPPEGTDLWAIYNNYVSVAPLSLTGEPIDTQSLTDSLGPLLT